MLLLSFILFNGCSKPYLQPNSKISTKESNELVYDTSVNTSSDDKIYLFHIYSEKTNIEEAVNEIALKLAQQFKGLENEDYIKNGDSQRMEDARVAVVTCEKGHIDNLVEGGTLWVYSLKYELKPKEPDKFVPRLVLEYLQDNGWIYHEGTELLIYRENTEDTAPYYLASTFLFDEFLTYDDDGEKVSTEEVVSEIIKSSIPELKLIKN